MIWLDKMFHVKKPIIGMLHIRALPGDPKFDYATTMEEIVAIARHDLHCLQDGGVDGILFSNEYSLPYQRKVDVITPAAMARIIGELMDEIHVPFGVDVISDGLATIELAAAVSADFVRGTFTGAYVGDGGIYNTDMSQILRRKKFLGLDKLKMMYFLNPESDVYIGNRNIVDIAKSVIFKCDPSALCVSAKAAGSEVSSDVLVEVKAVSQDVPVICNTGVTIETIEDKLSIADAACVGTTFKIDGVFENIVDKKRVQAFMEVVSRFRNSL